jgi:hypothetical protein
MNSAKDGKRMRTGAKVVMPSSLPDKWARTLDQRQSSARATSRARDRIERNVTNRCSQMRLVDGSDAEAALPEMSGPLQPSVDRPGITAVHRREGAPQSIGIHRRQDQVNVIGHQPPGPDLDLGSTAGFRQEVSVKGIVGIAKEGLRSTVAALGDVMRHTRDHQARKAAHVSIIADQPGGQFSARSP